MVLLYFCPTMLSNISIEGNSKNFQLLDNVIQFCQDFIIRVFFLLVTKDLKQKMESVVQWFFNSFYTTGTINCSRFTFIRISFVFKEFPFCSVLCVKLKTYLITFHDHEPVTFSSFNTEKIQILDENVARVVRSWINSFSFR